MTLKYFVGGGGGTTGCYGGECPTVYKTDRGTFVVQGNLVDAVDAAQISVAPHEGIVEIPESLVRALAHKINTTL